MPAALATSAPEARVRAALQGGGLDALFSAVVTGDDVSRGRPDPEPYLLAAQQLGRPPVRCVLIGNSNQARTRPACTAKVVRAVTARAALGKADLCTSARAEHAGRALQSVEAARESGMAAVVVAGQQPLYELGAADLVVRQLDELSLVNLKQLFRNEAHVEGGGVRSLDLAWTCAPQAAPARGWLHCLLHCLPSAHTLGQGLWAGGPWSW